MLTPLLPEIVTAFGIAAFLCILLAAEKTAEYLARKTAVAVAAFAVLGAVVSMNAGAGAFFSDAYRVDLLSQPFKAVIALGLLIAALFSGDASLPAGQAGAVSRSKRGEYFLFLLTATLGMMMLASANEALTFIVGLELSAYSLYLLVLMKDLKWNAEAGIKYIVFGAAMSGLLLYGMSLLMGLTQTASFTEMAARVPEVVSQPVFLLGIFLVAAALFFKLSLFPFHFWAPDAYEAAPTTVTTFIATSSKAAAVVILLRIFSGLGVPHALVPVLAVLAFLSMTVGNAAALVQRDTKRLLAYSSIAQAGYIMVGLLSATPEAFAAVFFYAAAYVIMNLGAFVAVMRVGEDQGTDNPRFDHFNGLADRSPLLALLLLVSLLSLAGIPPLIGFTGKWFLFAAAMKQGHALLVLAGVINSVISLFYYLTVIKHAYLLKAENERPLVLGIGLSILCLALFAGIVAVGVYPAPLLAAAQAAFPLS